MENFELIGIIFRVWILLTRASYDFVSEDFCSGEVLNHADIDNFRHLFIVVYTEIIKLKNPFAIEFKTSQISKKVNYLTS